ncbi:MAG: alpha-ketoglutarate-dependent dioxygenase AlkB [Vulcanimicrobiaceae bacterium]
MATFRRLRGTREASLFSPFLDAAASSDGEPLIAGDAAFRLVRGWLARERADALLKRIRRATPWTQERRTMYDRVVDVPREQAWYGDGCERGFTPELAALRRDLEAHVGARFGYVLLNRYRDGNDSVAWHNDREVVGVPAPNVASLTLGATRAFDVRAKTARARIVSVDLDHGDLVVMGAGAQERYEHRVPKDRRIAGERINLTFRQLRFEERSAP